MCMSALTIISTAFSVIGQLSQGSQQQDWAEYQAEQAKADAQAAKEEGEVRAEKRRKLGKQQQSEAHAALAASGVEVGAGTPVKISQQIAKDAESDAQQELLTGIRKGARLDQEAEAAQIQGSNAMTKSVLGAGGTLATGWKKSKLSTGISSSDDGSTYSSWYNS